jgi:hypothetical protein
MRHPEYLRLDGGLNTIDDDRNELRRVAKQSAGQNEKFLRDLMGDDEYEAWDND